LKGRVDLKIENVENTVQAHDQLFEQHHPPECRTLSWSMPASDSALNPTIKKACDAGIVVISFDQVVTEPCALAVASDWDRIPSVMAEWMATQLGGKGNIILDRGLAGAPISAQPAGRL